MISGDYPCCGAPLFLPLFDGQLPAFEKHVCPGCGATVWTYHSRMLPETFTEDEFRKRFGVNEETKVVTDHAA
jgi:hypothetical protein